jgi:hypothetical protein
MCSFATPWITWIIYFVLVACQIAVEDVRIVVDDIIVASSIKTKANVDNANDNTSSAKVCCRYHLVVGEDNRIAIPDTTGIVFCNLKRNDHDDDGMMKIA